MKSRSRYACLLASPIIPSLTVFVATALPARLYAEVAPPFEAGDAGPPMCEAHDPTCDDAGASECVSVSGGPGVCVEARSCTGADGGVSAQRLCRPLPTCASKQEIDACAGKKLGDPCEGAGMCTAECFDGGAPGDLSCKPSLPSDDGGVAGDPDAGNPGTVHPADDAGTPNAAPARNGGCSMSAAGPPGVLGAALGLLSFAAVLFRRKRRAARA